LYASKDTLIIKKYKLDLLVIDHPSKRFSIIKASIIKNYSQNIEDHITEHTVTYEYIYIVN